MGPELEFGWCMERPCLPVVLLSTRTVLAATAYIAVWHSLMLVTLTCIYWRYEQAHSNSGSALLN